MVQAKDIPNEQRLFVQIWELFKRHFYEPDTEENWAEFFKEANEISRDYGDKTLARKLIMAIVETKEELLKEEKKEKEGGTV